MQQKLHVILHILPLANSNILTDFRQKSKVQPSNFYHFTISFQRRKGHKLSFHLKLSICFCFFKVCFNVFMYLNFVLVKNVCCLCLCLHIKKFKFQIQMHMQKEKVRIKQEIHLYSDSMFYVLCFYDSNKITRKNKLENEVRSAQNVL